MTARAVKPVVPLAYQRAQAAAACGVSVRCFDMHIRPHVRCVYVGNTRLWATSELQRFLDENGSKAR
jgi:hypothetical protein